MVAFCGAYVRVWGLRVRDLSRLDTLYLNPKSRFEKTIEQSGRDH